MSTRTKKFNLDRDAAPWKGGYRPYDIAKELTVCFIAVTILVVLLAVAFGSPDDKAISIKGWSNSSQVDFAQTAITELDGTSASAQYGPPYNTNSGSTQKIGPISLEKIAGVHHAVNPPYDFVLYPLSTQTGVPALKAALATFNAASPKQQAAWEAAYETAVAKATVTPSGTLVVPAGNYGPVGVMIAGLTNMARSGALDAAMLNHAPFYTSDYTRSLLFLADGGYLAAQGDAHHLTGGQWGMMNETGSFPGQPWLWLYTFWYQIPPFTTSWAANADAMVMVLMVLLTLGLALVPFIPGLRSIPRWTRVYKIIWRDYYKGRL